MNLRDLRYIVAVADTGSFSKAAQACFVSQPALSAQIAKLENYLDIKIFERQSRAIVITEIGAAVIAHARRIVLESERLLSTVRDAGGQEIQAVSIGCFPTLAPYLFPSIAPALIGAESSLRLNLVEERSADLLRALNEGKLDIAFLALPVPLDGLDAHTLFSENFLVCMRAHHPLAKRDGPLHYEHLAGEELLLLADGHCMRDQALSVCAMQDLNFRRDYSGTSLETLRQMVAIGAGITFIPELAVRDDNDALAYRAIEPSPPDRTIAMLWRSDSPLSAYFENKLLPPTLACCDSLFS
ncbi:MAG: LysR family hydrogen peroxide-inducible transcriptional activator [Gammaproteobacteria bacterium]|jgi:LysR family hydrogen peroxide-inducible transcriptional activator